MVTILKSGFHWSAFGNQQGSTFTETNRNGLIHHIGCLITLSDRNGPILVLVSIMYRNEPYWSYSPYRMLNYPIGPQRTYSYPSFNRFWPYRMLSYPIGPQRIYSWPSLSDFDYILDLVSTNFNGPNHRIGQGCAGRA